MYKEQFDKLQLVSIIKAQGDGYFSGCNHYSSQLGHIQVKPHCCYGNTPTL